MTRLRVLSDLHLEFGPLDLEPVGEDVLALAGDIGLHTDGAEWAAAYARRAGVPVVMVAGNHEFYRRRGDPREYTVNSTLTALLNVANREPGLTFLEDDFRTVAGVTFVGCTLWTDYELHRNRYMSMKVAQNRMNDHRLIHEDAAPFSPEDARRRHEFSRGTLRSWFNQRRDEPLVVVTHHLPSAHSLDGRYGSALDPAYASDLDSTVAASGAALWVHGHTHVSQDYLLGATRVLCNPRGYYPDQLNPDFDPTLIVEV